MDVQCPVPAVFAPRTNPFVSTQVVRKIVTCRNQLKFISNPTYSEETTFGEGRLVKDPSGYPSPNTEE